MSAALLLSLRRLRHDRLRTFVLVACLAVPIFLPLCTGRLARGYERELAERAAETPFVAGPKGSRFDLVLGALWFRANDLAPIPWSRFEELAATGEALFRPHINKNTDALARRRRDATKPIEHELSRDGARYEAKQAAARKSKTPKHVKKAKKGGGKKK